MKNASRRESRGENEKEKDVKGRCAGVVKVKELQGGYIARWIKLIQATVVSWAYFGWHRRPILLVLLDARCQNFCSISLRAKCRVIQQRHDNQRLLSNTKRKMTFHVISGCNSAQSMKCGGSRQPM